MYNKIYLFAFCSIAVSGTELLRPLEFVFCYVNEVTKLLKMQTSCQRNKPYDWKIGSLVPSPLEEMDIEFNHQ